MRAQRQRDFLKLWGGQTVSEIGSRITREGLPLAAVMVLKASAGQMGLLMAVSGASVLAFGLAAGVIADRLRRRPLMIAADLGRAAILGTIPLAAALGVLSMTQLLVAASLAGVLTVLFDVSYQSYVPSLMKSGELLTANRRLSVSSALAEILGPGLTGVLVQLITAPAAILWDAISFVVSAVSVWAIRTEEPVPAPAPATHMRKEIFEGGRAIWEHRVLRFLCLRSVMAYFFMGAFFSLYVLFAIRVLRLSTSELGAIVSLGGVGSMLGVTLTGKLARQFQSTGIFLATALIAGAVNLLIPLAAVYPKYGAWCLGAAQLIHDCVFSIYVLNETTLRQQTASPAVLGRVNAAMQLASRGMLPLGALAGGFLADAIGIPRTLWIGACGVLAACLWLLPIARVRMVLEEPAAAA